MNTTKESHRETNRKITVIVGILFIVGTVSGILLVLLPPRSGQVRYTRSIYLQVKPNGLSEHSSSC